MKITIITIGKIKEKFYQAAVDEYSKRLSKYLPVSFVEAKDDGHILKLIAHDDFAVFLDISGKSLDSEELSQFFAGHMVKGTKKICFIIGGPEGLSPVALKRADFALSFSKFTFPNQLMRVILIEQIYRSMTILNNEPYHK